MSKIFPIAFDSIFSNLFRQEKTSNLYANEDCTKYSLVRIDQTYFRFGEGIRFKYPGYRLDERMLVCNVDDLEIEFSEFRSLMLSKLEEVNTSQSL